MLMIASVTLMIIANTFSENENMDQTESIAAEPCEQHACLDELSEIRNDNQHQCHVLDDNHADSIYESCEDKTTRNIFVSPFVLLLAYAWTMILCL